MADSGDIDAAIVARLQGDAALKVLLPDGVWFDVAEQSKRNYVLLNLVIAFDRPVFGAPAARRGFEELLYMIKAVTFGSSGSTAKQAALRIDQLLEDAPLVVANYAAVTIARVERFRDTEDDPNDATIRWQHRGGRYRVLATPIA